MGPPTSPLFSVVPIPASGRGALADQPVPRENPILSSGPPTAHVIFRQYRKEVCAQCFFYDGGRTLSARHATTGKFFCNEACLRAWVEEEGALGVVAWECLCKFVLARAKGPGHGDESLNEQGVRPSREEIAKAWSNAGERKSVRSASGKKIRSNHAKVVDPDILGYLLSNILAHYRDPNKWRDDVEALALDEEPYRSTYDLTAHTDSLLHLGTILPQPILASCTPETCHLAVSAASHNSFGVRSEDGEEYMGYALYPDASYFNHACSLNVVKRRDGREWIFEAGRDIEMGEELCITYLGGDERDMKVGERRASLKEHWGFECMCGRCCDES